MNLHSALLYVDIQHAFSDSRKQDIAIFGRFYYIDVICACLHNIIELAEILIVFGRNFHADQIANEIPALFQFDRVFSRDQQITAAVFFRRIAVGDAGQLEDHHFFEETDSLDFHFPAQSVLKDRHLIQAAKTFRVVRRRIYFHLASDAVRAGQNADF